MNQDYKENGFFVTKSLFKESELRELRQVLLEFHESWKRKNSEFYLEKAINSAYVTGVGHLDESKRDVLFKFIGSSKLMSVVRNAIKDRPSFMGAQLFFNPVNEDQNNYWHRDPQYHMTVDEQKEALSGPDVVHVRIPLANEPGIELVPGTHIRWDTDEELEVRLERNSRKSHDNISTGVSVELEIGDLLVFSANMIHRGLYGMDRLSFDILFCDPEPSLANFISEECLPKQEVLANIEDPSAFLNTIDLQINNKAMHAAST